MDDDSFPDWKEHRYAVVEYNGADDEEIGVTWITARSYFQAERTLTNTLPEGWKKSRWYIHHPNGNFYMLLHEDDYKRGR